MRPGLLIRLAVTSAALVAMVAAPAAAWARRNGIGTNGCDGCHGGGKPPVVTLTANPPNPAVGQATTLTVTVSQINGAVAGFFLTTEETNTGTFRATETGTLASTVGVTHTAPRTGTGGVTTFTAQWSATVATGVQFAVYVLSGNGDGTQRGDGGNWANLALVTGCTGTTYYLDQDGDGYGTTDPSYPVRKDCVKQPSYAPVSGDCNDFSATVHPGAPELCDAKDNNCDGKVDEAVVSQMFCEDKDGDGHGVLGGMTKMDCAPSAGFGDCNGDCSDANVSVYPGGTEICDGRDNNCDGKTDEGVRMTCGVGWCRRYADGCSTLCTPGTPIAETCNYFDDDCDGEIDNATDLALCGGPDLVCVLGKCIAGVSGGGGSTGEGTGGTSGGQTGGRPGGGNAGSMGSGGPATGAGGGNGGSGGGAGRGGGDSGCTVASASGGPETALPIVIALFGISILATRSARRRR